MSKAKLSDYIRTHLVESETKTEPGPYITISRQPGCEGYKVGDLLLEILNKADKHHRWQVYKKEILQQLAEDTQLAEEIIEQKRHALPSIIQELFRGMSKGGIPDGYEIRRKITAMVRSIAYQGYAIIVGQGGTAATYDIANGLSVRIEAPEHWRMIRVCKRDNLSKKDALAKIHEEEAKRSYLRKIYEEFNPHTPAFNITVDNSVLTAEQIASLVHYVMQIKGMAPSI